MIHFLYLVAFALFVALAFGAFAKGTPRDRIVYGLKTFAQFVLISVVLAWVLYFLPF